MDQDVHISRGLSTREIKPPWRHGAEPVSEGCNVFVPAEGLGEAGIVQSPARVCKGTRSLCRGFGSVLGAYNAPLQVYAVMVQQDAAGVRGVPEILYLPPRVGVRGLKTRLEAPITQEHGSKVMQ
jgi:hypothetical protein